MIFSIRSSSHGTPFHRNTQGAVSDFPIAGRTCISVVLPKVTGERIRVTFHALCIYASFRGRGPAGPRRRARGPHVPGHRAPALDGAQRRPDPRRRRRPDRPVRHPRAAAARRRAVRRPLPHPVRRRRTCLTAFPSDGVPVDGAPVDGGHRRRGRPGMAVAVAQQPLSAGKVVAQPPAPTPPCGHRLRGHRCPNRTRCRGSGGVVTVVHRESGCAATGAHRRPVDTGCAPTAALWTPVAQPPLPGRGPAATRPPRGPRPAR